MIYRGCVFINSHNNHSSFVQVHLSYCTAGKLGGGFYIGTANNNTHIINCSIERSSTANVNGNLGGAMYLKKHNHGFLFSGSTVSFCYSYRAGGFYLAESNYDFHIFKSIFSHCSSTGTGGAIYLYLNNLNFLAEDLTISQTMAQR